jgi:hypothetical protein
MFLVVLPIEKGDDADQPIGSAAISTGRTSLAVSETQIRPGTNPRTDTDTGPSNDAPDGQSPSAPSRNKLCERSITHLRVCPKAASPTDPTEPPPAPLGTPAITVTDLAQFAPEPPTAIGEPDNLGVAGMPVNFVVAASAHTRTGALFGTPLTVRFTPVGYDFRYGDGTTATTTTAGQTWSALGQAPFTPTPTSHTYRGRGTFSAGITVRYTAEVDLGSGWFPVAGELAIDGSSREIRIFEAHTALVARTCIEQPAAPGC